MLLSIVYLLEFLGCFIVENMRSVKDSKLIYQIHLHSLGHAQMVVSGTLTQLGLIYFAKHYQCLIHSVHLHDRVAIVMPVDDDLLPIETCHFQ